MTDISANHEAMTPAAVRAACSRESVACRLAAAVLVLLAPLAVAADAAMEVRCAEIAFSQSVEMQDVQRFVASIDPDARFVGGSERVSRGPDEVLAAWTPFFAEDGPRIAWRPQIVEVLTGGDLALSRGPYRLSAVDEDGELVERWGTFNSVWRRDATGAWRVIFDAGSASTEEPPEGARELLAAPEPPACRGKQRAEEV